MDMEKEKEQIFVATTCSICGLCKDPKPDFCMVLYDADSEQFLREIVHRIGTLREIFSNSIDILFSFEGFCRLFCKKGKCPLYDKQCDLKLSTRISCYKKFLAQNNMDVRLDELSKIYKKWAGIGFDKIGEDLDPIINVNNRPLSKSKRKKLRKSLKRAKKQVSNNGNVKIMNKRRVPITTYKPHNKVIKTSFFCNSNDEWEKKISQYLTKNE